MRLELCNCLIRSGAQPCLYNKPTQRVVLVGQVVLLRSNCSDPIERGGVRVRRRGTRRARPRTTSPAGGCSVRDSGTAANCAIRTRVKLYAFGGPSSGVFSVKGGGPFFADPPLILVSASACLADEDIVVLRVRLDAFAVATAGGSPAQPIPRDS